MLMTHSFILAGQNQRLSAALSKCAVGHDLDAPRDSPYTPDLYELTGSRRKMRDQICRVPRPGICT